MTFSYEVTDRKDLPAFLIEISHIIKSTFSRLLYILEYFNSSITY